MSNDDKFEFLAGEVNALRAVLMALVATQPDHRALLQELDRLAEQQRAVSNPMPVTEQFIEGQARAVDAFRGRIVEIMTRGRPR